MKLSKVWTAHLQSEDRSSFTERFIASKELFDRLNRILEDKTKEARRKQLSTTTYELPAWSENQADLNGYQRAMEEIIKLLETR